MVVGILAELNPAIVLCDGPRRALVFGHSLAIAFGTNPVDRCPEAGLFLVHVSVEDKVDALLLIALEVVVLFLDPHAQRHGMHKLTYETNNDIGNVIVRIQQMDP